MLLKTHIYCNGLLTLLIFSIDRKYGLLAFSYGGNYILLLISAILIPNLLIDTFGHRGRGRDRIMHGLFTSPIINGFIGLGVAYVLKISLLPAIFYYIVNTLNHLLLDSFTYQGIYVAGGYWLSLTKRRYSDRALNYMALLIYTAPFIILIL